MKIFCDVADLTQVRQYNPTLVQGFTTNPTLLRRAGVHDYGAFIVDMLALAGDRPVSFEVTADSVVEMERQADQLASYGPHVYVKLPITLTNGQPTDGLIARVASRGVQVNVTAVCTLAQVRRCARALALADAAIVSMFAGRIADTGVNPMPMFREARELLVSVPRVALLWASAREALNVRQAMAVGCDIITLPPAILDTWRRRQGIDLKGVSVETVREFHRDAEAADLDWSTVGQHAAVKGAITPSERV